MRSSTARRYAPSPIATVAAAEGDADRAPEPATSRPRLSRRRSIAGARAGESMTSSASPRPSPAPRAPARSRAPSSRPPTSLSSRRRNPGCRGPRRSRARSRWRSGTPRSPRRRARGGRARNRGSCAPGRCPAPAHCLARVNERLRIAALRRRGPARGCGARARCRRHLDGVREQRDVVRPVRLLPPGQRGEGQDHGGREHPRRARWTAHALGELGDDPDHGHEQARCSGRTCIGPRSRGGLPSRARSPAPACRRTTAIRPGSRDAASPAGCASTVTAPSSTTAPTTCQPGRLAPGCG